MTMTFSDDVVVYSSHTHVDTDALVVSCTRLSGSYEHVYFAWECIRAAQELLQSNGALAPEALAFAKAELEDCALSYVRLVEQLEFFLQQLTYAALIYAAAENDVFAYWQLDYVRSKIRTHMPFRLPWAPTLHAAGFFAALDATYFRFGASSDLSGVRMQMSAGLLAALATVTPRDFTLSAKERARWNGQKAGVAASALLAAMSGDPDGRTKVNVQHVTSDGAIAGAESVGVAAGYAAASHKKGSIAQALGFGVPTALWVRQGAHVGAPRGGATRLSGSVTETPRSASDLLHRVGEVGGTKEEGRIEILKHDTPGHGTSWSVIIPGTKVWSPGGPNPQDILTNTQLVGGLSNDQSAAVLHAMKMAGIAPGEAVEFVGHSQGGMAVAQLASSPQVAQQYNVVSALSVGGATAYAQPAHGVNMLNLENTRDVVPAADGASAGSQPGLTSVYFDGKNAAPHVNGAGSAHSLAVYEAAMGSLEDDVNSGRGVPEVAQWLNDREEHLALNQDTVTTSYIFTSKRGN